MPITRMASLPSPRQLRLQLVVGVRLYREGVAAMLARRDNVMVVGVESDGHAALDGVASVRPDVILLDSAIAAQSGFVSAIKRIAPQAHVVALGISDREDDILACTEAGVSGYVTRDATFDELVAVLEAALVSLFTHGTTTRSSRSRPRCGRR